MSKYTATAVFHYPQGVLLPGETAELSRNVAVRGLSTGSIAIAAHPKTEVVATEPDETQE